MNVTIKGSPGYTTRALRAKTCELRSNDFLQINIIITIIIIISMAVGTGLT